MSLQDKVNELLRLEATGVKLKLYVAFVSTVNLGIAIYFLVKDTL
jgi:hypothetical protein